MGLVKRTYVDGETVITADNLNDIQDEIIQNASDISTKGTYSKPSGGIPSTDMTTAVQTSLGKADTAYQKPSGGIPSTDLASGVQTSLGKADTAYQKPSGGIPSTDLASAVQTSLGKADSALQSSDIDSTLTVTGKAADAKKTGDEISGVKNILDTYVVSFSTKTAKLQDVAVLEKFYIESDNALTEYSSSAWRSTTFIDCANIKHVKTFVDSATKPAIMYFSSKSITDYISGEYWDGLGVYDKDITVPSGAQYCIIQCLNSKISYDTYAGAYTYTESNVKYPSKEEVKELIGYKSILEFKNLVKPNGSWVDAIQYALNNYHNVFIPYSDEPYYIDDRLLISSNTHLVVDNNAVIYLMDNTNTCFIRNTNPFSVTPDHDIEIEGGIWYGNYSNNNTDIGNGGYCGSDKTNPIRGISGMISMSGVSHFRLHDIIIKQCRSFGIQITDCQDFEVANLYFDDNKRDGVHCTGSCEKFHIHDIHGLTKDDFVALNAWDWYYSTARYGTIKDGIVENLFLDIGADGSIPTGDHVRVLCGEENDELYTVDNVVIRNLFGTTNYCGVLISHEDDREVPSHTAGKGAIGRLKLENLYNGSNTLSAIKVENTDVDQITINGMYPTTKNSAIDIKNTATIQGLVINGYHFKSDTDRGAIISLGSAPKRMVIENSTYECAVKNNVFTGFINAGYSGNGSIIVKNCAFKNNGCIVNANSQTINSIDLTIAECEAEDVQYGLLTNANESKMRIISNDLSNVTVIRNVNQNYATASALMNYESNVTHTVGNVTWTDIT